MPKPVPKELPFTGYSRANQLLPFVPFARSTLWQKVKDGKFPQPIRFDGVTAWRNSDVWEWIKQNDPSAKLPEAANDPSNLGGAA